MTQVDTAETGQGGAGPWDSGPGTRRADIRRAIRIGCRLRPWKRGPVLAALALLLGLFMLLHAKIPNRIGNFGSLAETVLPWFGLFIPVLLAGALWRRSASAVAALLLPVLVWLNLFGGLLSDKSDPGSDLTVVSHNVGADNPDPTGTAHDLAASGADMLALEELTQQARGTYEKELANAYPYHTVQGTVGLWSKLPLSDTQPVDIKMDYGPLAATKPVDIKMAYTRALRTTVATDQGPLAVYVAHLGSARVNPRAGFWTDSRDRGAQALGKAIAAEQNERVVLLGDLNGTMDDRAFADITSQLRSAQDAAGNGFGFSWPAKFPVVRIDQILVRGVKPESSWSLPATGSDHLPVAAGISW
ncbi:endonuclease/exonuclease/phosphatase family protein [Streptomyces scopuliridis]|uniref:Endonuclease/exonuclease/phosphatase family protein n=1 Tax=Streptomyces scopuliridis TaxID=452529 RepID=A0ACD4ZCT9_9ACTN|nr:endonuclease/exonuclease/phosphatase family protein [Streptomyces scopuliridis]WSB31727.1 endonuclease/exonuclease/phosphatase family protein [Streptomyces scopuliridis]WSB95974.1 endonuclease/exonuclease/phosphatase family protein [Streptomyces scopuliridis]WSC10319.1 endonuclease/exonuclease/phosphatase family protein [Streptomyces scopuliridis]